MSSLSDIVPSGVVTGDDLVNLLDHARANSYAIPAVNCTRYVYPRPSSSSSSFDERHHLLSKTAIICDWV